MQLETKMTNPEAATREVMIAFEAFKEANDQRLAAVEAKGASDILLEEKVNRIDRALARNQGALDRLALIQARPGMGGEGGTIAPSEAKAAWGSFVRRGDETALSRIELKALSAGIDGDGGYVAPPEVQGVIDRRLTIASPFRRLASVRQTTASTFKKPVSISAASVGWATETGARPQTNTPTLDLLSFPAGELYAQPAATQTLLDDAAVDIDTWLAAEIADAFAAQESAAFMSGDGVGKPKGILAHTIVADASQVWGNIGYRATGVAGGFAATNPADTLIDLTYAPKAAFRPNASFVMNRRTVSAIRKFKDTAGNYIWQPATTAGQPANLLGYPLVEIEETPDIAANAYAIAFGDFEKGYLIVDRMGVRVLRDPYTAKPYVLFYVTKRVGGGIQHFDAIKLLKFAVS